MKKGRRTAVVILAIMLLTAGCKDVKSDIKQEEDVKLDKEHPVVITVWNYYTGNQQESFGKMVETFNSTKGKELGIVVKASSQGSITNLENEVMAAVNKDVGAEELPNIFAAYAETAYKIDQLGMLADIGQYMTEKEIGEYVDSYVEEGKFSGDGSMKIFPVAKATEIFMLNKTDWDKFQEATGADLKALATVEGVAETARRYYEWTDSLTAEREDGKAFYGRDAMGNYMLIGAKQLGTELFQIDKNDKVSINFNQEVIKKLWDYYYIPFINGYFSAGGRFRSDDIKTGGIISFVGSSAGATFFPDKVIMNDDESYPIETMVLEAPQFEGSEGYAIQQGAGMSVTNQDAKKVKASVEFLKWMTDTTQNLEFALDSGYLPVKKEANDKKKIQSMVGEENIVAEVMSTSIDTIKENKLYTSPAKSGIGEARIILDKAMSDRAMTDREQVVASIMVGMTREEAVAVFSSDDYFEQWYQEVLQELNQTVE